VTAFLWILLAAFLLATVYAQAALAQAVPDVKPLSGPWEGGKFAFSSHGNKIRKSVNGISCTAKAGADPTCLIAFDEGVEARFVVLGTDGYGIDNEPVVLRKSDAELDAEAAATDGEYYYVTGSHSAKRSTCESNPGSRRLIRFSVDPASGKALREGGTLAGYDDSDELWRVMATVPELRDYVGEGMCLGAEPPPDAPSLKGRRGVNIEGMAASGGKLHFGFRGPAKDGTVPILTVDAKALFSRTDSHPRVTTFFVGEGRGIRDMTAFKDGMLVLAGPDDDEASKDRGWTVSLWDGAQIGAAVVRPSVLAKLDLSEVALRECDKEIKPEAISVVGTSTDHVDVVIMSDGMCDGGPLKFRLNRK
jgi:hypothetical protein